MTMMFVSRLTIFVLVGAAPEKDGCFRFELGSRANSDAHLRIPYTKKWRNSDLRVYRRGTPPRDALKQDGVLVHDKSLPAIAFRRQPDNLNQDGKPPNAGAVAKTFRAKSPKATGAPAENWRPRDIIHQQAEVLRDELGSVDSVVFSPGKETALKFVLEKKVGDGNFGDVFLGRSDDGTLAAVKISNREMPSLRQEADRMLLLRGDPGFPEIYAYGASPMEEILAMQYFPHGDLSRFIVGSWYISLNRITIGNIAKDAFMKLGTLNGKYGICHGDIKPENIFVNAERRIVIGDLGSGEMFTSAYLSERRAYERPLSAADDCFAMLLTILVQKGIMSSRMVDSRSQLGAPEFFFMLHREQTRMMRVNLMRKWDENFRNTVLESAARRENEDKVLLDVWDLLKSPRFNSLDAAPPNPHAEIMKLFRAKRHL